MPSLTMSFIPSPSLTISLTSPPLIMPPTHSNSSIGATILAGLIEGVIVAVVCIFTFLLIIVICYIKKKRRNHSEGQPDLPLSSNTNIEPRDNPAYANVNSFYDSATAIQDDLANATVNVNDLSATIQDNPAYGNNTAIMEDVPYACPSASSHTAFEDNESAN